VIGGGVCGLFLSYYLLQDGHDVVLADASKGPVRTSEFNAGQLSTRQSFTDMFSGHEVLRISPAEVRRNPDWFRLARRQTRDRYESVGIPLAVRSVALYERFFANENAKVDLADKVLDLHTSLPSGAVGETEGRFVAPKELLDLGYKGFEGGWLVREKSLHSGKLLAHLRERVSEMGARLLKGQARLRPAGSKIWRAEVRERAISADAYVVSAGSWSNEACRPLGYDPMVIPARGLVLFYRTKGERVIDLPAHYEDEGVTATQHDRDTLRFTSFFELVGFDPKFSKPRRDWLSRTVTTHFSRPSDLKLERVGVGFRPSTPDQLPVVGRIPRVENGYVLAGATRKGMALAPILAKLLIGSILGLGGKDQDLLDALDPARFEKALPVPNL
jgi:D-amino-acid dehydrogenase